MSRALLSAALLAGAAFTAPAQDAALAPEFEAATIKPAAPSVFDRMPPGLVMRACNTPDPIRFECTSFSLRDLLLIAYGIGDHQLSAPEWMNAARFDIVAKLPEAAGKEQANLMLRQLLVHRFRIGVHRENRELAGYALRVGPHGPKLTESKGPPVQRDREAVMKVMRANMDARMAAGPPSGGGRQFSGKDKDIHWLVTTISKAIGQPVTDETGLTGKYDLSLEYSTSGPRAAVDSDAPEDPSIFQAVQSQLGLKLEPTKMTVQVIVVDKAEKTPAAN